MSRSLHRSLQVVAVPVTVLVLVNASLLVVWADAWQSEALSTLVMIVGHMVLPVAAAVLQRLYVMEPPRTWVRVRSFGLLLWTFLWFVVFRVLTSTWSYEIYLKPFLLGNAPVVE